MRLIALLSVFLASAPVFAACELAETAEIVVISHEQLNEADSGCAHFLSEHRPAAPSACSTEQELLIREATKRCEEHARRQATPL